MVKLLDFTKLSDTVFFIDEGIDIAEVLQAALKISQYQDDLLLLSENFYKELGK